jgi:hypothetical protein
LAPTVAVFARRWFFALAFTDESKKKLYWIAVKGKLLAEKLIDADKIRSEEAERFKDLYKPLPDIISSTKGSFSWPVYELQTYHNGPKVTSCLWEMPHMPFR